MRQLLRADRLRRAIRDKFVRAVAEATAPFQQEQTDRIEHRIAEARQEIRQEAQRVLDRIVEFEIRTRRDIVYAADRVAAEESHAFVAEHMRSAPRFTGQQAALEHALSLAPTGGLALEFGVFTGNTLKIISAARPKDSVYGFDSFEGLPEDWRTGFPAGTFTVDRLPDVPGAELVVGLFDDTLPGFLAAHQGPVDFLHVDADLYSSAKTVLELVGPRLHPGSVVVFDEFFNFPNWQQHEYRAWTEFVEKTGIPFSYEGYSYSDEQVIVRIGGS